jgi:hypothetical protein
MVLLWTRVGLDRRLRLGVRGVGVSLDGLRNLGATEARRIGGLEVTSRVAGRD